MSTLVLIHLDFANVQLQNSVKYISAEKYRDVSDNRDQQIPDKQAPAPQVTQSASVSSGIFLIRK